MFKNSSLKTFSLMLLGATSLLGLAACESPAVRHSTANRVASPAWMAQRHITADPFVLTAYERAHTRHAPATVYIEGDGLNWMTRTQKSLDPTPTNPVALHLAAMDKSDNVIYLARPCQYSKLADKEQPCHADYWTGKRYAPEIIKSMNSALDNVKAIYDITEFNLVGFSGGANVAALLADRRDDVVSLRTVAGNLNHTLHSAHHGVSPLHASSLNAIDVAPKLADLPQRHFIGGQDSVVPPAIIHSFAEAVASDRCLEKTFVQENQHDTGWANKWPEFLALPVTCKGPSADKAMEDKIPLAPLDIKKAKRIRPSKP